MKGLIFGSAVAAMTLAQGVMGDCTTAATFTATATEASLPADPTKVIVSLPSDNALATQLTGLISFDRDTTWSVTGSVKMDPKYAALKAKLSFDAKTGKLTVAIGDNVGSDATLLSAPSSMLLGATTLLGSIAAGTENNQGRGVAAMCGLATLASLLPAAEAADACAVSGTIRVTYPAGFIATIENTDLEKGPISYNVLRTTSPTASPTLPTKAPTHFPTTNPTKNPTKNPTTNPTTRTPTKNPTLNPTTKNPTKNPTKTPTTKSPTQNPTKNPTLNPTKSPTTPFEAYINEVSFDTGVPDYLEIVIHSGLDASKYSLVQYDFDDPNSRLNYVGTVTVNTLPKGLSYCGGTVQIRYFNATSFDNLGVYFAIVNQAGAVINDALVGPTGTFPCLGGPFTGSSVTGNTAFPGGGRGWSVIGSGKTRASFTTLFSAKVLSPAVSNIGQTYVC